MKKLPLFVLTAATAMTVLGAPMTSHAAAFQMVGGSGSNYYKTDCSAQTGNLNSMLSRIGANINGRGRENCGNNSSYGFGQDCQANQGCQTNQNCQTNSGCGNGQDCGFGSDCTGNGQSCGIGQGERVSYFQ